MENYIPENTCRTCLQQSDELTSLYTEDDDTGLTLLEKLRFCVSMQVLVSERTPTKACGPCVRSIAEFCDFKRRCELSEKTLEGMCGEPPECAVPKIEVVYMEEDGGGDSTIVGKMEPEESNLSCYDGSDWTPGLDDEEKVDAKTCDIKKNQEQARDNHELELPRDGFSSPTDSTLDLLEHRESANVELPCANDGTGSPTDLTADVLEHRDCENLDLEQHEYKDKILTAHQLDDLKEQGRHPCDQCSSSFGDVYYLKNHKYRCHSVKRHRCDECGISFVHPYRLRKHMWTHRQRSNNASDELFNCNACKESFRTKEDLQEHVVTHLKQETKCDDCNKLFDSVSEMLEHKASAHPHVDPLAVEAEHQFKCGTCGECFDTESQMQEHARDHHEQELPHDDEDFGSQIDSKEDVLEQQESANQVLEQNETDDKILTSDQLDDLEKKFPCDECSSSFNNAKYLQQHKKRCHMEKQHRCDLCGYSFVEPYQLRRHMHTHRKANCDSCNKLFDSLPQMLQHRANAHPHLDPFVFSNDDSISQDDSTADPLEHRESANRNLEQHESKEHGSSVEDGQTESELKFVCETCGKRFTKKLSLVQHQMIHIGKYPCPVCCDRFKTKKEQLTHVETCSAEGKINKKKVVFLCDECPGSFNNSLCLSKHKKRFHMEKPLHCDLCGDSFVYPSELRRHMNTHTRRKTYCDGCYKLFDSLPEMLEHRTSAHPHLDPYVVKAKRNFKCGSCGKLFETESYMQEHYARVHQKQELPLNDDDSRSQDHSTEDPLEHRESANPDLEQHESKDKKKDKVQCDECPRSFFNIYNLKHHKQRRHMENGKRLHCDLCGDSFIHPYELRRHMITHTHRKAHCDGCNKLFDSLPEMLQHRTSAHPHLDPYVVKAKRDFKCRSCGKLFEYESRLQEHYARAHQKQDLPRDVEDSGSQNDSTADVLDHRESATSDLEQHETKGEENESGVKDGQTQSELKFVCETCGKRFGWKGNLKRHRKIHIGHTCPWCGKYFKTMEEQSTHVQACSAEVETGVKDGQTESKLKFACETCGKRFRWKYNYNRHRLLHIGPYSCPLCCERFKTKKEQLMHVETCCAEIETGEEHGSGVEGGQTESKLKFACQTCGKRFRWKGSLKRHRMLHDGLHSCSLCRERFKTKEEQSMHMQTCCADVKTEKRLALKQSDDPTEEDKHPCDECSGSFVNLKLHKMRRHIKRHRCKLCSAAFTQAYRLRYHMEHTHKKTANYVCETCGKTYSYKVTLRKHIEENHAAEKPVYTCNLCDKTYNFLGSLSAHKLTHKPNLRLTCDSCGRTYPNKVRLAQHVQRQHIKPHACDECYKRFFTKHQLLKHMGVHALYASRPYACKVCEKRFSTTSTLSFHMSMQHSKKRMKCDGCGKGYNNNRDLKQHKKRCAGLPKLTQQ